MPVAQDFGQTGIASRLGSPHNLDFITTEGSMLERTTVNGTRMVETMKRTISDTSYDLRGDPAAVAARVEQIETNYPPMGYGTTSRQVGQYDGPEGYTVAVRVWHMNSCD